jgi:tetratricopeptide (TPR) repeat protein
MTLSKSSIAALLAIAASACAAGPDLPKAQQTTQGDLAQVQTLLEKAQALDQQAATKEDVETVMKAYEEVLAVAPDHKDALVGAARFHYMHGNDVLTDKDKDARLATWLKGREYGLRALGQNAEFRAAYEKDNDMAKQVPKLGEADAGAMLWTGLNWAKWGELYGIIRAAIDIPKVKALLDRVNEVSPKYECNAADRFFMGYWVAIPGFAGRDPNKSKAAYERAMKMSPECMPAHNVIFASYYAKDAEDQALFTKLLEESQNAPEDAPESPVRLLNNLAKLDGKRWLERSKEIFE